MWIYIYFFDIGDFKLQNKTFKDHYSIVDKFRQSSQENSLGATEDPGT